MDDIREYTGKLFIGKKLHFKCECLFPIDFTGEVKGYKINSGEILLSVDTGKKLINVGLNHPNMKVENVGEK